MAADKTTNGDRPGPGREAVADPRVRTARFVTGSEDGGKRIDQLLAERVPELSRRRARILVAAGSVSIDGRRSLVQSRRVAPGQVIVCHDQPFASATVEALDPALVVHEDDALLAIDKPAGVPSHPTLARRQGTALQLVEEWLRRRAGRKVPLWPVHRLDADTSGVLLFAKTREAARALAQNLARRRVRKRYLALVRGVPDPAAGEIALAISEGHLRSAVSDSGKEARTRYRMIERRDHGGVAAALLEVEPLTGRMHQIRVHLAAIGHPVIGDRKYGAAAPPGSPQRLCLHAASLELPHPLGGRPLRIDSPPPREWGQVLNRASRPPDARFKT
jgi:23S rRNA pseudouridine1911/1915/1917 synthase